MGQSTRSARIDSMFLVGGSHDCEYAQFLDVFDNMLWDLVFSHSMTSEETGLQAAGSFLPTPSLS
jgi:hypothetical protein